MANAASRIASWQPVGLVETATRESLATFHKSMGPVPLLVVRLDDFSNDLGAGLSVADEEAERKRFSRAIKSTLQLSTSVTEQMPLSRTEELFLPRKERDYTPPAVGFPVPEWLSARCYVVRLSTRGEGPAPLSIGRGATHNIVLQHSSVSGTHAYLTVGSELSLSDAKSRNGTFVNDARLTGTVQLRLRDRIKFGAVRAVVCSADDIWHAARA